jgi:UDP-N-acetylglucosamine--N-acetylmuramyl-(pentapeptide) pyrophosphoryl-undecaprenol N-acetylglucosamine transferase
MRLRSTPRRRPVVLLIATPGGHLDLLIRLAEALDGYERRWILSGSDGAQVLIQSGEPVELVPRFHGFSLRNLALAAASIRPALRQRPDLVVTTGSGNVVPYCILMRLLGTPLIFVETMARVRNPSAAGRVLSRLAASVLVQWPEMASIYPRAQVCEPDLVTRLGDCTPTPGHPRSGTFLAVGTHLDPFDRVVRMVDEAVQAGILPTPVRAQTGVSTYRPEAFVTRAWMRPAEIDAAMADSDVIVCHAGTGLIARSLETGRVPLVVARRAALGEHVDDHQEQIVAKLADYGLVTEVRGDGFHRDMLTSTKAIRIPEPDASSPSLLVRVREEAERLLRA